MQINRKKYEQIKKMDHREMSDYIQKIKNKAKSEVHRAYIEALESVQGIGQKRREEVQKKAGELLKEKE